MKADFSGWATKNGLKCSDGRTIMPNAFQHQDRETVPLVWSHKHNDPENVLGHAILENRPEGVYAYAFFNDTPKGQLVKSQVKHGDIKSLSIWANQLIERSKSVLHGAIREVSIVLSGANPGALIDYISVEHGDAGEFSPVDEAIIYTGLSIEHSDVDVDTLLVHDDSEKTVEDVFAGLTDEQKTAVEFLVAKATGADSAEHSDSDGEGADGADEQDLSHADAGKTIGDVYDSLDDEQKMVVQYMIGQALDSVAHSDIDDDNNDADLGNQEGKDTMKHNLFDQTDGKTDEPVISHDEMKSIVERADQLGSLKRAVGEYALAHGITNIDVLFPDAQNVDSTPEWLSRRTEWVGQFLSATRHSPFARIKTLSADITEDEARAKGYITGNLKKEEFFSINKRTTVPTTVYKKQKLDRDDVIDITDFDVVSWLKGEMRVMLDEEIARAALVGDGRDPSSTDKIDEQCIRPIATDHELFTTKVYVNLDDASSNIGELTDALVTNRHKYKGSGMPTMYTTETVISQYLLLKDTIGRRIYNSLEELASELRVSAVVPVEVMEEYPSIVAILVNPTDYVFGTDRGGEVNMFDDFDIDYNNLKYLIETRCSGALTKLKSAICVLRAAAGSTLVVPTAPTFNKQTGVLTIINTTGVVYKNGATTVNAGGSPYAAIAPGASVTIDATPSSASYYFPDSDADQWTFTRDA